MQESHGKDRQDNHTIESLECPSTVHHDSPFYHTGEEEEEGFNSMSYTRSCLDELCGSILPANFELARR